MAFVKANRIQEVSTTIGTGDIVLGGVYDQSYRTFTSVMSNGDTAQVLILNSDATDEWEIDEAVYNSVDNSIVRTTLVNSSTGSTVSFTSGVKIVAMLPIASRMLVENNSGDSSVHRDFAIGRDLSVAGSLVITGGITITGNVAVTGTLTAAKFNNVTITAPATGATLTLANNSTLATVGAYASTLTFTGTTGVTFPTSGTLATTASPSASIVVGTTTITSGTTTRVLYDNAGVLGEYTISGSGTVVAMATSPSFTTPTLGVATATSLNGNFFTAGTYTLTGSAGKTLTFSNSLTLAGTDATVMTFPTTSATLARTDAANTFTGTQTIGALVATTVNGNTITTGTGVLTLGASKTATISNTLTFTGTDGSSVAFGTGGTVLYGNQSITLSGDVSGSGTTAITTTLATVASAGTTGSSTAIPVITINAKGLTTGISTAAVIAPAGTLTGATLASGVTASSLTSVGTIGTGVWQGTLLAGTYGGSGVNNGSTTFTRAGNVTFSGAFAFTGTLTNTTGVTFPTTGTLATLAGSEALTNKSVNGVTLTAAGSASLFLTQAGTYVSGGSSTGTGQIVSSLTGAVATGTTTIPADDTIPQNTEGDQYLSRAITPASATSTLFVQVVIWVSSTAVAANVITAALFQDSTANALSTGWNTVLAVGYVFPLVINYTMTSGTTSATTFKVRVGASAAGTTTINGTGGARFMGGVLNSSIVIREILP